MSLGSSPKGSPVARDKRVPVGLDFDLDSSAAHGTSDVDAPRSGRQAHQEAELENHDDRNVAYDPNGMGPTMRTPYDECSPKFEESNGMDQVWNENQRLGSPEETGYPRRSYPA